MDAITEAQAQEDVVNDPEVLPTDEAAFWQTARVVMPKRKETVTIRLDADLLAWFRSERGYQTRINAILRSYMNAREGQQG